MVKERKTDGKDERNKKKIREKRNKGEEGKGNCFKKLKRRKNVGQPRGVPCLLP